MSVTVSALPENSIFNLFASTDLSAWSFFGCVTNSLTLSASAPQMFFRGRLLEPVTLSWLPAPDTTIAGYKIYYGVASQTYTNSIAVGNVTNYEVNLPAGLTYYFAATTYDANGDESGFSNEVVFSTSTNGFALQITKD